jgi:hypothetical protein
MIPEAVLARWLAQQHQLVISVQNRTRDIEHEMASTRFVKALSDVSRQELEGALRQQAEKLTRLADQVKQR